MHNAMLEIWFIIQFDIQLLSTTSLRFGDWIRLRTTTNVALGSILCFHRDTKIILLAISSLDSWKISGLTAISNHIHIPSGTQHGHWQDFPFVDDFPQNWGFSSHRFLEVHPPHLVPCRDSWSRTRRCGLQRWGPSSVLACIAGCPTSDSPHRPGMHRNEIWADVIFVLNQRRLGKFGEKQHRNGISPTETRLSTNHGDIIGFWWCWPWSKSMTFMGERQELSAWKGFNPLQKHDGQLGEHIWNH